MLGTSYDQRLPPMEQRIAKDPRIIEAERQLTVLQNEISAAQARERELRGENMRLIAELQECRAAQEAHRSDLDSIRRLEAELTSERIRAGQAEHKANQAARAGNAEEMRALQALVEELRHSASENQKSLTLERQQTDARIQALQAKIEALAVERDAAVRARDEALRGKKR